jgi:hypothetical protein
VISLGPLLPASESTNIPKSWTQREVPLFVTCTSDARLKEELAVVRSWLHGNIECRNLSGSDHMIRNKDDARAMFEFLASKMAIPSTLDTMATKGEVLLVGTRGTAT